jgi:hypothetical protein
MSGTREHAESRRGGAVDAACPNALLPIAALAPAAISALRHAFDHEAAELLPQLRAAARAAATDPQQRAAAAALGAALAESARLAGATAVAHALRDVSEALASGDSDRVAQAPRLMATVDLLVASGCAA